MYNFYFFFKNNYPVFVLQIFSTTKNISKKENI